MIERRPLTTNGSQAKAPPSLEMKLAAALSAAAPASADLQQLLGEAAAAIAAADQAALAERERALDLASDPVKAREAVVGAEMRRDRLRHALPKLQQQLQAALADEYAQAWDAKYRLAEAERDRAAERFRRYPELAAAMVELLNTATAVDRQVSAVNGSAPDGVHRRLKTVELHARQLDAFSIAQPSISRDLKLPDWQASEQMVWPRKERLDPSLYAAPAFDVRFSEDWALPGEAQRAAAAEREKQDLIEADRARREFYGQVAPPTPAPVPPPAVAE
jgi:hypothetical protein